MGILLNTPLLACAACSSRKMGDAYRELLDYLKAKDQQGEHKREEAKAKALEELTALKKQTFAHISFYNCINGVRLLPTAARMLLTDTPLPCDSGGHARGRC